MRETEVQIGNSGSTPALVELNNSGVSANVIKAMMTPKNAPPRRGSHKSLTKE